MKFSIQDIELVEEAFPRFDIGEVFATLKNPLRFQEAKRIVDKNRYTAYCVDDIIGLHMHCFLEKDYKPLVIDFDKADLFFHVKKGNQTYTLLNVCFYNQNLEEANRCLDYMEAKKYTPEQIEKALFLEAVSSDIQRYFFQLPSSKKKPIENNTLLKDKKELDKCLTRLAKHIGAEKLLRTLFQDKIPADFKLTDVSFFEGKEKPALTLTDLLVKYQMPCLAVELLQQTLKEKQNQLFLLEMSNGPYMRQAMNQVYKNARESEPYKKEIYDYLESVIRTDLFIEYTSQKKEHFSWQKDFECESATQKSGMETPLTAKEKQSMQLDFMQQLFHPHLR